MPIRKRAKQQFNSKNVAGEYINCCNEVLNNDACGQEPDLGEIQGKSLNVHNQIGGDSFRAKKGRKKDEKTKNSVDFQQSMSMIIDSSGLEHLRSICITRGIVQNEILRLFYFAL